jgi:prepilin-type N-terminal cleavage/methylation domain-containing protein
MNTRPSLLARLSRGFTMTEVLITTIVLGIIIAIGVRSMTTIRPTVESSKLSTEVIKLNQIASVYLSEGGSFAGVTTVQGAIDKLKTIRATADANRSPTVMSGRGLDVRLASTPLTSGETASNKQRIIWDATTNSFKLATSGAGGVGALYLNDALATTDFGTESRAQMGMRYNGGNGWAWQDTANDGATNYRAPIDGGTTTVADSLFDPTVAPPVTTLPTPQVTPLGASYDGFSFPSTVTMLANGAPAASSQLKYMIVHSSGASTAWVRYTVPVAITYGDTVIAKNVSTNTARFTDSATDTEIYSVTTTTLMQPTISPAGGVYLLSSWPSGITLTSNGAPGGSLSALQYRKTSKAGVVGAWTNYTAPFAITYGDLVEAKNTSLNANVFTDSAIVAQSYSLALTALPTPLISPLGGGFPLASFPSKVTVTNNGAPTASSVLKYRRTTGGVVGAWTNYTAPISITYGDTIEAQNISTAVTTFDDSAINAQTYMLTTNAHPVPIITPPGGWFHKPVFPGSVTISANSATAGKYVLKYRKTNGGVVGPWTNYTGPVAITYWDTVEAINFSTDYLLFADSGMASETYLLAIDTLPTPIISPAGGSFPGASFPASATISKNGAPATLNVLKYRWTDQNGVVGPWTTYTVPIGLSYGETIEAQNVSTDPLSYNDSGIDLQTYNLSLNPLPTPIITPAGGSFTVATLPAAATLNSNGAPAGKFALQYLKVDVNGVWGAWTNYTSAVTIAPGDTVYARNHTADPFYGDSPSVSQTYAITATDLPPPIITPHGGTFSGAAFPNTVTINANGASATYSKRRYMITHSDGTSTAWATYTAPVAVTDGDTLTARNEPINAAAFLLYNTSPSVSETYILDQKFKGGMTASWTTVGGGPNLVKTIANSSQSNIRLTHGDTKQNLGGGAIQDSGIANVIAFDNGAVGFDSVGINQDFNLGTLVCVNGTTFNDSEATSATLHLGILMYSPQFKLGSADINFTMVSTPNSSDRAASADTVTIQNPVTNFTLSSNGHTYVLQIAIVSSDFSNGFVTGNTFSIYEGASASATLVGRWVPQ